MTQNPVIFQGTFDPFTCGHLAVLTQALAVFGQVRVLLLINPDKKPLFSVDEREKLIREITADFPGVSVDHFDGLLVDYMRARGLTVCVRGVRNQTDAAYELRNHQLSSALYPSLKTFLFACRPEWSAVSSSQVKEMYQQGCLPAAWAPETVRRALSKKLSH